MPTTPSSDNLTPMMRQYFSVKEHHKDHILMWRLGDFYEMFFDDATLASREIGLTLTGRDCGLSERAPMCGVPHHSVEGYIAKLIKKGFKVAICEQMEEASAARGVVSREVVRVITPGTLMESGLLDEESNNYLCAINLSDNACGFVFADISTGIMIAVQLKNDTDEAIIGELSRYSPREVIFPPCFVDRVKIAKYMREKLFCTADLLEAEYFERSYASAKIEAHFGKTLEQLGLDAKPLCIGAAGALLTYLESTQKTGLERLVTVNTVEESRYMNLDSGTRSNLELLETQRSREKRGSLLWVLDRTRTPMGKRLIKNIITTPLMSPAEIERRLSAVGELCANELKRSDIYAELSGVLDVERLLTRIVYGSATPREYKSLELAINKFPQLKSLLANSSAKSLLDIHRDIDELRDLHSVLQSAIVDDPPINIRDGGVIRTGYNADLDTLRELMGNVREILAKLESAEREKTGIKNLKIGYNKVFGYYLEVTRSYQHLVPEHYIRKQTLANNERYITQELKDLEERILTAGEQAVAIETALFEQVRAETARQLHRLQRTAQAIALLDVLQSFATAALEHGYIRPEVSLSDEIDIIDGRHPVVERMQKDGLFVPNDTKLNCRENQISIITGPNMAGKSTYMRQTALIVIMAQIGSFVPAKSARIGIVDGVYTRIGASDDLGAGQSTFMVEMSEVAQIQPPQPTKAC